MTGTAPAVDPAARVSTRALVLGGAVCGLAWAAALRGYMAAVAGPESAVDWIGTFEGILLPGAVTGGLLGWAEHLRRTGRRRGWLAAAPLVFVLATPSVLVSVFTDGGIGGGAVAIPLFGIAGGYALSGRGPRWARSTAGAFALLPAPAWLIGASYIGNGLAVDTPRGAWIAVLFLSLLAVLALGCTIPHRAPADLLRSAPRLVLVGAVCGLAWGAGMRAYMAAVAGPESQVHWFGTFGIILLLSAVVGGLLGWAEHLRRTGDGRRLRRLVLAPLLFTADPASLVATLPAMVGGYWLSGRGSRRARWTTGVCALLPVPLFLLAVTFLDDIRNLGTPRGAWTAVLLFSHLAVLTIACAIPHRVPASTACSSEAAFPASDAREGKSDADRGPEGRAAGAGPDATELLASSTRACDRLHPDRHGPAPA